MNKMYYLITALTIRRLHGSQEYLSKMAAYHKEIDSKITAYHIQVKVWDTRKQFIPLPLKHIEYNNDLSIFCILDLYRCTNSQFKNLFQEADAGIAAHIKELKKYKKVLEEITDQEKRTNIRDKRVQSLDFSHTVSQAKKFLQEMINEERERQQLIKEHEEELLELNPPFNEKFDSKFVEAAAIAEPIVAKSYSEHRLEELMKRITE